YEILFFWVARMIMFGCHFMKGHQQDPIIKAASGWGDRKDDSVPFRQVYIHALVRDAERQKMSKTKGNVIDPLEIIERFGTDATRFTLAAMAAPGTDIAFSENRTEGYRNFANKIWNAARFMFMNRTASVGTATSSTIRGVSRFEARTLEDRWILSRFNRVTQQVNQELQDYRFHEVANGIYDFFWSEFCDWYLELLKPRLNSPAAAEIQVASENLVSLFEAALRLLHPVMPFITEEIWQALYDGKPPLQSIALASYPQANGEQIDLASETEMDILQDLIVSVRNLRAELKVESKLKTGIEVHAHEQATQALIEQNRGAVERLASVETLTFMDTSLAKKSGTRSTARFDVHIVYERKIDLQSECARLLKELDGYDKDIASKQNQLKNQQFRSKAPVQIVASMEKRLEEVQLLREKVKLKMDELGCDPRS
ncbi:MAG: class I tRNA ligase family protein, partial [Acidobacteria bacterium]|nr:class I tRNA ligase family protein [Acidobacteriota bacterium]